MGDSEEDLELEARDTRKAEEDEYTCWICIYTAERACYYVFPFQCCRLMKLAWSFVLAGKVCRVTPTLGRLPSVGACSLFASHSSGHFFISSSIYLPLYLSLSLLLVSSVSGSDRKKIIRTLLQRVSPVSTRL